MLVKTDEMRTSISSPSDLTGAGGKGPIEELQINVLFHKLLYVSQNEEPSCMKLVHFDDDEIGMPSEMEASWKSKFSPLCRDFNLSIYHDS